MLDVMVLKMLMMLMGMSMSMSMSTSVSVSMRMMHGAYLLLVSQHGLIAVIIAQVK